MKERMNRFPLCRPLILLTILISMLYCRTLDYPWQLDDYHNITKNPKIQLSSLDAQSIKETFYATPAKDTLYRPVSYFTFALNWLFGQDDVTGYRLVNIGIHILTASFLFLTILLLFRTPKIANTNSEWIYFVALLSAGLWAIHPIQIQAVTYVVQRMASMAALFYVIGIFCFLKARLTVFKYERITFYTLTALAFMLAMGSKNNAIMLPIILLVIEFVFFRQLNRKRTQKQALAVISIGIILVIATAVFVYMDADPGRILSGYQNRHFTLYERLLTQPRIILFYLSLIFYPIASRFSLVHDIEYSTSLLSPWSTVPSILILAIILGIALWRVNRNPILSFSILFYFGNHVIESSILPLEMIFEHRNYLPTLFLFVPISMGIKKGIDYYSTSQKPMFFFLVFSVCFAMIGLGTSTYIRNYDWHSLESIWYDAMKKAPHSARPVQNFAWAYYEPNEQYDKAIAMYKKALSLKGNRIDFKFYSYNNLANIYFSKRKDYEKAAEYARQAVEIEPERPGINLLLCKSLIKLGHYDKALSSLDRFLDLYPNNKEHLHLKGFIFLKNSEAALAKGYFQKCVQRSPKTWWYLRELGLCFTKLGYLKRGYWFLEMAQEINSQEVKVLLALVENRIRAGKVNGAEFWIEQLIKTNGTNRSVDALIEISEDPLGLPFSFKKIAPLLSKELDEHSKADAEQAVRLERYFQKAK